MTYSKKIKLPSGLQGDSSAGYANLEVLPTAYVFNTLE
jgi:hypothetical protein